MIDRWRECTITRIFRENKLHQPKHTTITTGELHVLNDSKKSHTHFSPFRALTPTLPILPFAFGRYSTARNCTESAQAGYNYTVNCAIYDHVVG